jgi:Tfp pilus assembly protein PilF
MGKLFKKQKEFEKAEDNFKKCIKIDKNNYSALNALANLYCE